MERVSSVSEADPTPRSTLILAPNDDRCSNVIITAQYTPATFLPKATYELLHPYKSFANFYFFVVGLLQIIPAITLTNSLPNTWMPLFFIVCLGMYLKAREDIVKHKADSVSNSQAVDILSANTESGGMDFKRATWAEVRAGDVVKIFTREYFPADMLFLRASDPPGQCWVNTKPLDGETDSKIRLAPKNVVSLLGANAEPEALRKIMRGSVRHELPNDKVS